MANKTTVLPPNLAANPAEQVSFFPPPVIPIMTRSGSGLCSAPANFLALCRQGLPAFAVPPSSAWSAL